MYNYATPPGQNEPVWTNLTVQQVAAETILACTANGIPCTMQYGFLHKSGTSSRAQWYVVLQNVPADLTVQRVANLGCSHCAHLSSVTDKQPPVKKWAGMRKKLSLSSDPHIVLPSLPGSYDKSQSWVVGKTLYFLCWKYTFSTAFLRRCPKSGIYVGGFYVYHHG